MMTLSPINSRLAYYYDDINQSLRKWHKSTKLSRENDVLIFKSPHYSHFLLSIKHDEVLKTAAVLPNKSWTKEKNNLEALLSF